MFDWREYLELANDLGTTPVGTAVSIRGSEATGRCAVSRAYYAAFCHARNYAVTNLSYIPSNQGSDHWMLRQHFAQRGMSHVARRLRQLHGWRKQRDYDDVVPHLPVRVADALREATAVINQL
jgi:hypothetical protein